MHKRPSHARRFDATALLLLAALLFRAYIPAGFMPAAGAPFAVELCPAYGVMPAQHLHHHHSQGHVDTAQDCPFGSSPAAGPISHSMAVRRAAVALLVAGAPTEQRRLRERALRSHQPRGPPLFA